MKAKGPQVLTMADEHDVVKPEVCDVDMQTDEAPSKVLDTRLCCVQLICDIQDVVECECQSTQVDVEELGGSQESAEQVEQVSYHFELKVG